MKSRSESAPHTTEPKTFFITAHDAVLLQSTGVLNVGITPRAARGWYASPPWGFSYLNLSTQGMAFAMNRSASF